MNFARVTRAQGERMPMSVRRVADAARRIWHTFHLVGDPEQVQSSISARGQVPWLREAPLSSRRSSI